LGVSLIIDNAFIETIRVVYSIGRSEVEINVDSPTVLYLFGGNTMSKLILKVGLRYKIQYLLKCSQKKK